MGVDARNRTSNAAVLETTSVVVIATAAWRASFAEAPKPDTMSGMAARRGVSLIRRPMTPVDMTRTWEGGTPRAAPKVSATSWQSATPWSPVAALACPALVITCQCSPRALCWALSLTLTSHPGRWGVINTCALQQKGSTRNSTHCTVTESPGYRVPSKNSTLVGTPPKVFPNMGSKPWRSEWDRVCIEPGTERSGTWEPLRPIDPKRTLVSTSTISHYSVHH